MFGYATDETEECMPLTIVLAHRLNARMAELRRAGVLPWLRPDSKTQVGLLCRLRGAPDAHGEHPRVLPILVLERSRCSVRALRQLLIVKRTI